MPKSEKLFEMLELIKKFPNLSPKELAKRCGVSERAIYRYITTLSKVGILVSSQKGEYRLQGYYGDILSNFKPESLEAIKKLIQSGMRLYTDEKILQHGREFIKLIDVNLPKSEKSEPNEIDIVPDGIRVYERVGSITIGQSSKPSPINPILTNETISVNLLDLIFSSLIKFDSAQRPIPDVARNWEISQDGLEWTFFLREDVVFHDNEALTAQDVEFTYKAILDPRNASPRAVRYDLIEDIKTDGDYIIRFKLKHPFSAFMPRLSRAIAPKHLLEGIDIHNTPFNQKPIGSGPFKMADWNEDDTIVLEANENYFRKDRPILERLIFKRYPDTKAALDAISKGEMDVALNLAASDLLFFNESGPFRIYSVPAAAYHALVFNLKDQIFKDIRIRKAFDHAIDKEAIFKEQLKGHGEICTGPFPVDSWAYNQEIETTPYNIERAKELLKQSGWQDKDGDGILDKDGQIFEISISFTNVNDIMMRMANAISLQLAKLG
ncbi:HTH domain-containing protein, partial [Candidatus Poribacteria bacterium]|nr:HTH domain-containing protein [Candidatus Poribacteria bacterium]